MQILKGKSNRNINRSNKNLNNKYVQIYQQKLKMSNCEKQ